MKVECTDKRDIEMDIRERRGRDKRINGIEEWKKGYEGNFKRKGEGGKEGKMNDNRTDK
jgi:hypothetical protein